MDQISSFLGSGSQLSNYANAAAMQNSDQNNAQTTMFQMQAENQKHQMNRWKIMQDTQTKAFEIQQDVTVNKAKTADKMFGKWDEYVRS